MQQCTDARPNCRSRHREPNGNRRETTRPRSDTIVDLRPTPRSLGGLSGYSTKPAGKEQAKTHEGIGRVLAEASGRRIGDAARCWQNQAQKSITECTIPRRGVVQKTTNTGDTPTPKEQSENNKPEHHRQDRPPASPAARKGLERCTNLPKNPSADQQHTPVGATLVVARPLDAQGETQGGLDNTQPMSFRAKPGISPPFAKRKGARGMPEGEHPQPSPLMSKGEHKGVWNPKQPTTQSLNPSTILQILVHNHS